MEKSKLIILDIPGIPIAWKAHGGYGRKSFNPLWREREYYQAKIREQYSGPLLSGALSVEYIFFRSIPKSVSQKLKIKMLSGEERPSVRPDRDNNAKFLSDCLQGIVFEDDAQIVDGPVRKYYGEKPHTIIKISQV